MTAIPHSAREVLESDHLAHLVTINEEGTPQISIVWVGLDGDEIVMASLGPRRKLANIDRDPRVALSVEGKGVNPMGLKEYLVVQGHAHITDGGGPELLQRLAGTYLGPGVKFPPMEDPPPGRIVHIAVDRVGGVGPWAATG